MAQKTVKEGKKAQRHGSPTIPPALLSSPLLLISFNCHARLIDLFSSHPSLSLSLSPSLDILSV